MMEEIRISTNEGTQLDNHPTTPNTTATATATTTATATPTTDDLKFMPTMSKDDELTSAATSSTTASGSSTTSGTRGLYGFDHVEGDVNQIGQQFLSQKGLGWLFELDDDDPSQYTTSLLEELDIDVKDIAYKVRCVLFPYKIDREVLVSSPDFWGPLGVVFIYSMVLMWGQLGVVSWVITMWIVGSLLVFLLARVLGADITYSQTLGVIGYSLLPLTLTVSFLAAPFYLPFWLHVALKILATFWSAISAESLLVTSEIRNKRILLAYPIVLLYIYFVGLHSGV